MKLAAWFAPVVAAMMLIVILVPAKLWRHPVNDAVYQGFDSNLLYTTAKGNGSSQGLVEVASNSLQLTALPRSQPTVELVTSPLSYSAAMNVRVLTNSPGSVPLTIGVWSPSAGSAYDIEFGPPPQNAITAEMLINGSPSRTLVGARVASTKIVGTFIVGQRYRLTIDLDRRAQAIYTSLTSVETLPFQGGILKAGGPTSDSLVVQSAAVPITSGTDYAFGGWANPVEGAQPYAFGILWSDNRGKPLPSENWWRQPSDLSVWTRKELHATAPPGSATARLLIGTGKDSAYLFGEPFLRAGDKSQPNLLSKLDFSSGAVGWRVINRNDQPLDVIDSRPLNAQFRVTASDFPSLFASFRPSLTVISQSDSGVASASLDNYSLTLPSQPNSPAELVEKIDDKTATTIVLVLAGLGSLLIFAECVLWVMQPSRPLLGLTRDRLAGWKNRRILVQPILLIGIGTAAMLYLLVNSVLFHLGSPHFDVFGPKVWSYIASHTSFLQLYHRSFLTPSAAVSAGVPWHEAGFPYGPVKAYYYLAIGWIYQWILSPPGPIVMDTFQLEFLIKALNVLFGLADGLLVYLILRRIGIGTKRAAVVIVLFLFNPALLFLMSIWGSTETVSLFFILSSVLFAEKERPTAAWLALMAGAFTRPQMFVLAFLLGVVYLRKFAVRRNVAALSWTTIILFLFLAPFAVSISPSLPVDYITHILGFQVGTGQADTYSAVSPGYYSVWTLPLDLVNHQSGIGRMWYPRTAFLFGSTSYATVSAAVTVGFLILLGLLLLVRGGATKSNGDYLPVVAFGMFGWLVLSSALISRYFLYGLVLVLVSRKTLGNRPYYFCAALLTTIVFVTSYGHFALDVLGNGMTANPMHPANSLFTRGVLALFSYDPFISLGTFANIGVLIVLGAHALPKLLSPALSRGGHAPTPGLPELVTERSGVS